MIVNLFLFIVDMNYSFFSKPGQARYGLAQADPDSIFKVF